MEILNWRDQPALGDVVAIFDIYFPKSTETKRFIKLMISKKGTHYFRFPSGCEDDGQGNKKWFAFSSYGEEKQREFINALYEAVGPFVKGPICRSSQ